ncbi:MAG: hypothetical protein M3P40_04305 [Actinomycetota bacterium]|nr:hypothetical protein [Actinomycetota bacterium]
MEVEPARNLVLEYAQTGEPPIREQLWQRLSGLGVLRSRASNPTGDYAEWLVARHYNVALEPPSAKGFDLALRDGTRVQVRGRHVKGRDPSYFKVARGLWDAGYDQLALVFFEPDYRVRWACAIPRSALDRLAVKYENTDHRLRLRAGGRPGDWIHDPSVTPLHLR